MSKGDRTRQRIIEKSAPVFNQLGYGSTSMSCLMEATGLEKGGLYRHFSSKEELACEAFDYACKIATEAKFQATEKIEDGYGRLEEYIKLFTTKRPTLAGGCPIFNTAVENDDGNPVLKKKAKAAYKVCVDRIARYALQAKAEGVLKQAVDVQDLAGFIFNCLEGALIAQNLTGDRETLNRTGHHLLNHLKSQVSTH
jgi:TetR/AcrR family transcriptional repressor of nem operon